MPYLESAGYTVQDLKQTEWLTKSTSNGLSEDLLCKT